MATTISADYKNAVVGYVTAVTAEHVVLVECDDPFVHHTVPMMVDNKDDAMFLVDTRVCVYDGVVYPLPERNEVL